MKRFQIILAPRPRRRELEILFLVFTFFFLCIISANSQEKGFRKIWNFSHDDYNAHEQNWAVLQGKNGLMYFGNNTCLLEYDGISWNKIKVPKDMAIRSLAMDSNGKIYVGGQGDFGFLQSNEAGTMEYKSLLEKVDKKDQGFYDVWILNCIENDVYFQTFSGIFRLRQGKIKAWGSPKKMILYSFQFNNKLYYQERNAGIFRLDDDTTRLVSSFKLFRNNQITFALPATANEIYLSTFPYVGLFKCDFSNIESSGEKILSIQTTAADSIFKNNLLYRALKLNDGNYALGTIGGGVIIINGKGGVVRQINSGSGLQNDLIYGMIQDREGNIWMALNSGISRVDYSSPVTSWRKENNLVNSDLDIVKSGNILYLPGIEKLNFLKNNKIDEIRTGSVSINCSSSLLFKIPQDTARTILLIGTQHDGLLSILNNKVKIVCIARNSIWALYQSRKNPSRLFIGMNGYLASVVFKNNSWHIEGNIKGVNYDIRSIQEDSEGNIWLGTQLSGVIKIVPSDSVLKPKLIIQYTKKDGLPSSIWSYIREYKNGLVFITEKGIYRFDSGQKKFISDCRILPQLCDSTNSINEFREDQRGRIWVCYRGKDSLNNSPKNYTGVAIPGAKGKYSWIDLPFKTIREYISRIYPDSDSTVWMGSGNLYFFNGNLNINIPSYAALIRKVLISEDSVIFGGSYKSDTIDSTRGKKLPFRNNSVTFQYSAPTFYDESGTEFQTKLEGFDSEWSKWTKASQKTFNNLTEKNYRFHVRAKNIYDKISKEDIYEFKILPPWYRSFPAYLSYFILFFLGIYTIVRLNTKRLRAANLRLELIVKERTAEVEQQRDVVINQKNQIERIASEVTDSINYARYIQNTIFPKDEKLEEIMREHFVLFKPKDIVSGDFYWVSNIEEMAIIAVGDCTGHGVPGAFMSMLGTAYLNEIVNKEYITHPGVILRRLRKEVIRSLQQKGEMGEQKDGMDVALCTIDHKSMKMQFAGANNPVYIVRDSNIEEASLFLREKKENTRLYEIKGDHMPIGIYYKLDDFNMHEIDIFKGDSIYLFSDGFADQFGGPEGKKFSYGKFRKQLIDLAGKPMKEQKEVLKKSVEEWMGTNSQVDDIIVFGFKIG
jgi:serine phosphatase RsbU (regulator of sigma subunit)/ligand-binding sensor domain-containing protein